MKKKSTFAKTKVFAIATKMPPGLRHSFPDQPFDIKKSEPIQWLISQPEIISWLFNKLRDSGAIVFDQNSKSWKGIDS